MHIKFNYASILNCYNLTAVIGCLSLPQMVFCGHEYSVANLLYAQHVEPDCKAVADKLAWAKVCDIIDSISHEVCSCA